MFPVLQYARVLAHYPYAILLVVFVLVSACLVVILTAGHGLDFDDPLAGFEPRGTKLSDRLITFENLLKNVEGKANLLPFDPHIQASDSKHESVSRKHESVSRKHESVSRFHARRPPHPAANRSNAVEQHGDPQSPSNPRYHSGDDVSIEDQPRDIKRKVTVAGRSRKKKGRWGGRKERDKWSSRRYRRRIVDKHETDTSRDLPLALAVVRDAPFTESNTTWSKLRSFCGIPDKAYARVVITSSHSRSILNRDDLLAMCHMEATYFRSWPDYKEICLRDESDGQCCPAWSLANYVALLAGRDRCEDITSEDVTSVHGLLSQCAPFFHNFSLGPNCAGRHTKEEWFYSPHHPARPCAGVPDACRKYNAVFHILHFLSDSAFMHPDTTSHIPSPGHPISHGKAASMLKYSTMFLPVAAGAQTINLFDHLDSLPRTVQGISVVGAHFGAKYSLFERYLVADSFYIGLACSVIFLSMWIYTSSLFVTVTAFMSMFWAVEVAYFLYTFVFKIKFFPYMNMVTLIVMVGIGADDLFIYCKVWHLAKAEKNNGVLQKIISDTLRHTALSMLVTSLTSAAAFYANYVSDITSIRCFSVFAGTCIVINFILTVTWLPASVMVHERWFRCCSGLSDHQMGASVSACCASIITLPYKMYFLLSDWSRIFFEKILPCLVIRFRFLWIVLFGGLWAASVFVIFYYPRLKLPNSRKFQMFSSDHLSERYDFEFGDKFDFERTKNRDDLPVFPITVVWGLIASDTGDPLNPYSKGSLTFDPDFDMTTPSAQEWLLDFCYRLRNTDFYVNTPGIRLTDCFMENFVNGWMKQSCREDDSDCCMKTPFPFKKGILIKCLADYIPQLRATPGVHYNSYTPGPRFHNGRISAFFVQFLSNQTYSHSYTEVERFYKQVNSWVEKEIHLAPEEMRRGWFVSHLHFYDLQSSLALGTPLALGVSLSVVAIVAFFTTLNVLVSVFALLAVGGAISTTLAALVLMGWTLDILESVVITVAVGLAIDMTLHFGVAFRLAPDTGREMRVVSSLERMGSPVTMAAVTTMLAGAFMMPSTVLVYRKFGTFLLLLVSLAWQYATFFFQALLRIAGPHGGFGQFHWPVVDCCSPGRSRERVDKTVYSMSESTLSSSSTSAREHSHGHNYVYTQELEPLTGRERLGSHHSSRRYCHRHHPISSQLQSSNSQDNSHTTSSSGSSERKRPVRHPHLQNNHHHHHHHHHHSHLHNNCHHHHQNSHGRPRLKSDYVQVCTAAEVLPKSNSNPNDLNIPTTNVPYPSCPSLHGTIDTVISIKDQTNDRDVSKTTTSLTPSSPELAMSAAYSPTSNNHANICTSLDITPSNSSTLSPSPHHDRLSASDLSEASDQKHASSDSDVHGDAGPIPSSTAQLEFVSHSQPLTVS
ncbi:protein dispatched homolog 1 [Elysia marginata]|uniref:Protein dispatched homolog 1 n=1 Tax=Elysia marginata TaxID=1093978 RepID=A0AAV4H2B9_9GAST|nr:protein dispatched homolog 1 [Elysia marginata]